MSARKKIGFLSFGAWHPGGGLTHTGGDALRQTVQLAAEAGQRTLLWDLDPQAAATFALTLLALRSDGGRFGRAAKVSTAATDTTASA